MLITYEEILQGIDEKERRIKGAAERWNFYAAEVQKIQPTDYSRRMAVAECAIRAVSTIRKGKRAKDSDAPTLARFASQCRLDRRTLGDWVKAKTEVFNSLTDDEKIWFSVSRGVAAVEYAHRTKAKDRPVKVYRQMCNDPQMGRKRKHVAEYLRATLSRLKKAEANWFTRKELDQFMEWLSKIEDRILELKRKEKPIAMKAKE